jgi:prepilin-type N-terminal cleavage/methylation domain-containing protein/prepilin-type processing-associated H-X9-DG protein
MRNSKKGFTLIELLVVVAIIALLVSILVPAMSQAQNQAKGVVCQSNLKQTGLAYLMYTDYYDGYLPFWLDPDADQDADPSDVTWYHKLANAGLLEPNWSGPYSDSTWLKIRTTILNCPMRDEPPEEAFVEYHIGYNHQLAYREASLGKVPWGDMMNQTVKIAQVEKPSTRMMAGDARDYFLWNGYVGTHDIYPHDDGMNIVFADGSVDWFLGPLPADPYSWDFPW